MQTKKITKTVKPKTASPKKTREEIEKMFSFDYSCDCSHCEHHCGDEK